MKLGAEPKKVAILVILLLIAAYFLFSNLTSSPVPEERRSPRRASTLEVASAPPEQTVPAPSPAARANAVRRREQEFRPSFKHKGVDPSTIDPKLRLDLLAKVRSVELEPAGRNLFAYGSVTPAGLPPGVKEPRKIDPKPSPFQQAGGVQVGPAQPPPPPPINLKYYGYTSHHLDGPKRAFFSEGDCSPNAVPTAPECNIFIAAEGDLIQKRYKIIRIGANSAEVEDIQFNHTQPLPITPESPG